MSWVTCVACLAWVAWVAWVACVAWVVWVPVALACRHPDVRSSHPVIGSLRGLGVLRVLGDLSDLRALGD